MTRSQESWLKTAVTIMGILGPALAVVYSYSSLVTEVRYLRHDVDRLRESVESHERWHAERLTSGVGDYPAMARARHLD